MTSIIRVLQNLVSRATVKGVDAGAKMQTVTVERLGTQIGAEHMEPYGFTSRPAAGAEAVVLQVGATSHPIVIVTPDRRYRIVGLETGDVAIYDSRNHAIILKESGIEIEGDVKINGNLSVVGAGHDIKAGAISLTGHTHLVTQEGAETNPPTPGV